MAIDYFSLFFPEVKNCGLYLFNAKVEDRMNGFLYEIITDKEDL